MDEHQKHYQALVNEQTKENDVLISIENGVLNILLNRPGKSNGLSIGMYVNITNAINNAQKDEKVKIIVLSGLGKNFCSGNDLQNFMLFPMELNDTRENKIKTASIFAKQLLQPFVDSFINSQKLILAKVQGVTMGIGFTIIGLCDFVYCTNDTKFSAPLVKLAQGPEGCSSFTFPHYFGAHKANEVIFFGKDLSVQEALKSNFVNQAFDNQQTMEKEVNEIINTLINFDQESVFNAKRLLTQYNKKHLNQVNNDECENLINRWSSDQLMVVIANFFNSRKPKL